MENKIIIYAENQAAIQTITINPFPCSIRGQWIQIIKPTHCAAHIDGDITYFTLNEKTSKIGRTVYVGSINYKNLRYQILVTAGTDPARPSYAPTLSIKPITGKKYKIKKRVTIDDLTLDDIIAGGDL